MISHIRTTLTDSYKYREVLGNIISQHLKVKYRRTFFGYIWSLLNPILQLTVLTAVFSHVVRLDVKDYTLYLFSGLIPWTFFSSGLIASSVSLLEGENYIRKIYLPKLIFPLSKISLVGIDFLFSLLALSLLGALVGFKFSWAVAFLPLAALSLVTFTLGLGLIFSVATVFFRDVQYLLGVFLQLLYFLTPVLYPVSVIPEQYQKYYLLNPVVSQIGLFQKILYHGQAPTVSEWGLGLGIALFVFFAGLFILAACDEEVVFRL